MPTMVVAAAVLLMIHMVVPPSLCVDDAQYLSCNTMFECGKISGIGYPFWRDSRQPNCGYPGDQFKLTCTGGYPEIDMADDATYHILKLDNINKALTLARKDYPSSLCLSTISNVTLNYTAFDYTSDNTNFTFYYRCETLPVISFPSAQLKCGNGTSYFATRNTSELAAAVGNGEAVSFESYLNKCQDRVMMPLYDSAAAPLKTGSATPEQVVAAINNGFGLKWSADNDLCDACVDSGGVCGHNTASGKFTCYCKDKPHSKTCAGSSSKIAVTIMGVSAGVIVIGVAIICALKGRRLVGKATTILWKKETAPNGHDYDVEAFIRNYGNLSPKQFTYSCVKKMTNSFSHKLGQGGYGSVYKGTLQDGRLVAVKILKDSKNDGEGFMNEVASISRTSHVNVVALLGFCYQRDKKALVYEFMPNGSLDGFVHNEGSLNRLEWNTLFEIVRGIARGLEYLHRGCSTRILHFDIKPHNILLDKDLVPKISDFGLAKLCTRDESVVSMMGARGTIGYIAPEVFCRNFGGVSHKSDVYSYGMMVLEMVGGRKNIDAGGSKTSEVFFPSSIYGQVESGEILKLEGVVTEEEDVIVRKMVLVSLWCIQTMPASRPSMSKVLEMLEGSIESLQIPPKPILTSPPRLLQHSSTISAQQSSTMLS